MPNLKTSAFVLISLLALSGCSSTPHAQSQCPKPPAPPAWMMLPAPNSLQTLDKIISISESN